MEELSYPKLSSKRQRLAYGTFQTKPEASSLRSMLRCHDTKHHDWGWMLGCWHSAVFRNIVLKRYDPIFLFVEDKSNGESVLIKKIQAFDSCDSLGHSTSGCSSREAFEPMLIFPCQIFSLSFWPFWTGNWKFLLLCQSCHFLAWVVFEGLVDGFLVYTQRSFWSRTIFWELWDLRTLFHAKKSIELYRLSNWVHSVV